MKKSDTRSIKANNIALLYECLRNGAHSRAQIVQNSGLSKATVTAIVGELIADGALRESGLSEAGGVGRPRTTLELVKDYRYAIGMTLHRRRASVNLINLAYEIVDTADFAMRDFSTPEQLLDTLYDTAMRLCQLHDVKAEQLIGIGVSTPGPVDYRSGIIHQPPGLTLLHHFPVREYLSNRCLIPVYLDHDSTLLAMREGQLRKGDLKNWIFVGISDGIGSAFFCDGKLYRGNGGYAGELGHTSIERNGIPCACGNRGCLERYISMDALRLHFGFEDYPTVVDRAEQNDAAACEVLDYIAEMFSHALVNYVNLVNPEAIVLHGELNYKPTLLFSKIERLISRHSAVAGIRAVRVLPACMRREDNAAASAAAILEAYFAQKFKQ